MAASIDAILLEDADQLIPDAIGLLSVFITRTMVGIGAVGFFLVLGNFVRLFLITRCRQAKHSACAQVTDTLLYLAMTLLCVSIFLGAFGVNLYGLFASLGVVSAVIMLGIRMVFEEIAFGLNLQYVNLLYKNEFVHFENQEWQLVSMHMLYVVIARDANNDENVKEYIAKRGEDSNGIREYRAVRYTQLFGTLGVFQETPQGKSFDVSNAAPVRSSEFELDFTEAQSRRLAGGLRQRR